MRYDINNPDRYLLRSLGSNVLPVSVLEIAIHAYKAQRTQAAIITPDSSARPGPSLSFAEKASRYFLA
jgi:hypothetical protein